MENGLSNIPVRSGSVVMTATAGPRGLDMGARNSMVSGRFAGVPMTPRYWFGHLQQKLDICTAFSYRRGGNALRQSRANLFAQCCFRSADPFAVGARQQPRGHHVSAAKMKSHYRFLVNWVR
jgi:hypothetical protein